MARALARGKLAAVITAPVSVAGQRTEPEALRRASREVDHSIDFVVQYPQGDPVAGHAYELLDPGGQRTTGKLGAEGTIHKDHAARGTWIVTLKEIERAAWTPPRARAGKPVKLTAQTSGFPDGARVRVRLFREHAESDDEAIEEIEAVVNADRVELDYAFDDSAGDRRGWEGSVSIVAELALEGGRFWTKTVTALKVELKTFDRGEWLPEIAHDGDRAEFVLQTFGIDDGASIDAELWVFVPEGEDRKLVDLPSATVAGGVAEWSIPCKFPADWAHPDAQKSYRDGSLQRPGEYYVVAKLASPVERKLRSRFLPLHWTAR
ncbi:MAG: hypothetical protein U0414_18655 [Polyangiaceae bacterium]